MLAWGSLRGIGKGRGGRGQGIQEAQLCNVASICAQAVTTANVRWEVRGEA